MYPLARHFANQESASILVPGRVSRPQSFASMVTISVGRARGEVAFGIVMKLLIDVLELVNSNGMSWEVLASSYVVIRGVDRENSMILRAAQCQY